MDTREHWDAVYRADGPEQHSWFQAEARLSRRLIERVAPSRETRIVDIGAGASQLVDALLHAGYHALTVLDIAPAALEQAQRRLGSVAGTVSWQVGDVRKVGFPPRSFDVWHDRAVFHYLVDAADRSAYLRELQGALCPGGHVILATFADDGPGHCSGLPVACYSAESLHDALGPAFHLVESHREIHRTPARAEQVFTYVACEFIGGR
jgi:SAM-dependent methyltransferase